MKQRWMLWSVLTALVVGCGSTPTSDSTEKTTPSLPAASENTETQGGDGSSTMQPLKESYVITFMDEDGKLLESKEWKTGTVPSYEYQKEDTEEWHYTFLGWSTTLGGESVDLTAVKEDKTYYAVIRKEKVKYDICFYDEEGKLLATLPTEYGAYPAYTYQKQDTAEWKYTFLGWSDTFGGSVLSSLPKVTGARNYYAVIDQAKQVYTLRFDTLGGSSVDDIVGEYGTSVKAPEKPTREGYSFVCWCLDSALTKAVSWPYSIQGNITFYVKWNEAVDIKGYLKTLTESVNQDPYSYIPKAMRSDYTKNHITASQADYDFESFVNVSDIHYGGFGEQWEMVLDNIAQSEKFYQVLTLADSAISSSVAAFNNWFDKNPDSENKDITENGYYAKVSFKDDVLNYTLQIKTGWDVPFFGKVVPQIDMSYHLKNKSKSVRINLTDTNAMKYYITDGEYVFGIRYGVEATSRTAYCSMKKDTNGEVEGHIYEYISLKDKDAVKSCADFYLGSKYSSIVGNKASGIIGMDGYINELYKTEEGKLLAYKVQETKTIFGITGTYHTLWFNLNSISGINTIKVTEHTDDNSNALNTKNVYVNSDKLFEPTYNTKLMVKTSRKYDVEMRNQYFYSYEDNVPKENKVSLPMMFIQDNYDNYTNFDDFPSDMKSKNKITAKVVLPEEQLKKIRSDYDELIPVFKVNKEKQTSETIQSWIGNVLE